MAIGDRSARADCEQCEHAGGADAGVAPVEAAIGFDLDHRTGVARSSDLPERPA